MPNAAKIDTNETDTFAEAMAKIPSCALDEAGLAAQRDRHARLAPRVTELRQTDQAVVIEFAADFDRQALVEMVAVEEQCCPFFAFAFDEDARRLEVTVKDPEMSPALEAIAEVLGSAHRA